MSKTPTFVNISVLLSVCNGEKYLREAIESLLNQSYSHFELLALDDGSTDSSLAILKEYARKDHRIRIIENTSNLGLIASLNQGLRLAKYELVARMDADDICLPTRLETQIQFFNDHPECVVLGTNMVTIETKKYWRYFQSPLDLALASLINSPLAHPTVMFKKAVILSLGGYPNYPYAEDYGLWSLLQINQTPLYCLPEAVPKNMDKHTYR